MTHRSRTITLWERGPLIFVALALAANVGSGRAQDSTRLRPPPAAAIRRVTDDYFGTAVVDNYRWMEDLKDPEVQQWMKAQADYTRATLDALPGRAALLTRIKDVMDLRSAMVSDVQSVAGHYYTLRTPAGAQSAKLYVRDSLKGTDRLLIDPEDPSDAGRGHASISFYVPSPDNRYVAYGRSAGGSASAVLHVFDIPGGKETGEIIEGARFAHPSWRDGRSFYYTRLQGRQDKVFRAQSYLHVIGRDPNSDAAVLGFEVNPEILQPAELPTVYAAPGTGYAVAVIRRGVEQARRVYAAPLAEATAPDAHWRPIAPSYEDGSTAWETRSEGALTTSGDILYMISRRNGPNGEIVSFDLGKSSPEPPKTILTSGKLPIEAIQVAKDALYVQVMDGGVGRVERVAFNGAGGRTRVALPFPASVLDISTDPGTGGSVLSIVAWTRPRTFLDVEPGAERATDAGLQPPSALDRADDLEVHEVMVKSWDSTEIPLSIVSKKGLAADGSHPVWLDAYGAYGYPATPGFFPGMRAALERGVILARAHVRGGGDYGEAWHLAGYKLTKPNTWRDFIACAEYLVSHRYTSPSKLFGVGASAGGILIGRAIEERPDLFAAAIATGPIADALRWETTANGEGNEVEFGSVKSQEGFEDLFAMSPYVHVRDGVKYPAVLVQTGINDNRVAPWIPAKFAARLQAASTSGNPVLLRIDYDAGHVGIGDAVGQEEERFADVLSFALWRTGDPAFQPKPAKGEQR
jgi:prolyl oligopeptidase